MSNRHFLLDGQLALVTGGGTGIGLAISHALIEAEGRVIITGRREDPLKQACEELGGKAHFIQHDVGDIGSIPALIERIENEFGPLEILVNNAGINMKKSALETTAEEMHNIMEVDLLGPFALCRECGIRMVDRKRGSIVNIVSMAAIFGLPLVSAYSAAKSGLMGLTRVLASEYSPHGVRVNAIAPGFIETEMSRKALANDPPRRDKILARTPMGTLGQPDDIGHATVYLCSPAGKFVTGVILPVDGGVSIGF